MHFADLVINKGRSLVVVVMVPSSGPAQSSWHQWQSLPQTPEIDDGIRTPPTPPLSALGETPSDEEMFAVRGFFRFVNISGKQSNELKFDHVTSYGWLISQAKTWCEKELFAFELFSLTFPLQDPTYNVRVSSRGGPRPPEESTRVCYRKEEDKIHQDCWHVMFPGMCLEVTVVADSVDDAES
jgi:hypothetical protein